MDGADDSKPALLKSQRSWGLRFDFDVDDLDYIIGAENNVSNEVRDKNAPSDIGTHVVPGWDASGTPLGVRGEPVSDRR